MDHQEVLGRLCALAGPSGFEGTVAREAARLLEPLVDRVQVDRMGSVVAVRRCGRGVARGHAGGGTPAVCLGERPG